MASARAARRTTRLPYVAYGIVIFALSWLPLPHGSPLAFFVLQGLAYLGVGMVGGFLMPVQPLLAATLVAEAVVVVVVGTVVNRWGLFLLLVAGTALAALLGAAAGSRLRARRLASQRAPGGPTA